jgi:hypothetical protein
MTPSQVKKFKAFAAEHALTKEDFFKAPQGFVCVKLSGIEKIQKSLGIIVHYEHMESLCIPQEGLYVIKATAKSRVQGPSQAVIVETYGEVSSKNNRNSYPVAMAEKRALSRVVLKMADMYMSGVKGEDELQ